MFAFLSFLKDILLWSSLERLFVSQLTSYARRHMVSALQHGLRDGSLLVTEGPSKMHIGQSRDGKPKAIINVKNDKFWLRVFLRHDLGFSEAYMHGDFDTPNLKAILDLWLDNHEHMDQLSSIPAMIFHTFSALFILFFGQSLSNSKLSAVNGYDCSNAFFESMLSKEMMYSCALWTEENGGVRGDLENGPTPGDLEEAQQEKLSWVLKKARVKPGHRLLEFGTGWGGLSIAAAKLGCTVDSLTLSVEQKKLAEARIKELGLESKITVHLLDYRKVPEMFDASTFDAFVALEMVEAVGVRYLDTFFNILDYALKPKAAIVVSATSQPEFRFTTLQTDDYARHYQWPNTFCPSTTYFLNAAQKAVKGRFVVDCVEDHATHYCRTLREWNRRFHANWDDKLVAQLIKDQPQLAQGDALQVFKRKWEYMCVYAEVGYARAYTSLMYWVFARPEYVSQRCD